MGVEPPAHGGDPAHVFSTLENAIRAAIGAAQDAQLSPDGFGLLLATWSMVHGFAHLALGGELDHAAAGRRMGILDTILPLTLKHLPTAHPG